MKKFITILVLGAALILPMGAEAATAVSPTNLNFGTIGTTKTFTITTTLGSLQWAVAGDGIRPWLTVTPLSGIATAQAPSTVTVTVTRAGLPAGDYSTTLAVTSVEQTSPIQVTMIVEAGSTPGAPGAGPTGVAPTEGVPAGLSPCTMEHEVQGCGGDCSETGSAGNKCLLEACCLLDRIYTIADWIFVILLVVAGIFIIWGAFEFVTSGGTPEKVTSARNKLVWALVGVIVAFIARSLVRVVAQIVAK